MNKDLINQLAPDEQPVASKLDTLADDMQLSPGFQWELENQLMDAHKTKTQPQRWQTRIIPTLGWALVLMGAAFALTWTLRSLAPSLPPAAEATPEPGISFESGIREGSICTGPLALAHGFTAFLTNEEKTGFVPLDEGKTIGELRSIAWSPDGGRLAIVGNTAGRGNIYFADTTGGEIGYLLASSELGYLVNAAWSRDGRQLVTWSGQNNTIVYLLNTDGTPPVAKQLGLQVFGTPQFTPDGESIVFYGADSASAGLFEAELDTQQTSLISAQVEDERGFAFSPDGARLAYVEMDRDLGEARLIAEELATGRRAVIGTLPIPKGSGSSLPESANLSWSANGESLVFEFGRGEADRAIYLAATDGTGLVKVADSAHTPAISADERCLAYISNEQVFLLDLTGVTSTETSSTPVLLADLPTGRGIADFKLDRLQWKP